MGGTLCAIGVGVTVMVVDVRGIAALNAEDTDDDDIEFAQPSKPARKTFLAPVLSGTGGINSDRRHAGPSDLLCRLRPGRWSLAKPLARFGTRFSTNIWWEPTSSLMLQALLSARRSTTPSANRPRRDGAGSTGSRSPEAARSSDYYSGQTRVGAHITGLRTGDYEWTIAAGHIADSYDRDGIYARIGVLLRPPRPLSFEN